MKMGKRLRDKPTNGHRKEKSAHEKMFIIISPEGNPNYICNKVAFPAFPGVKSKSLTSDN